MRTTMTVAAVAAMILSASVAWAGQTAEQKCEAGKNDAAGKYDACAAKAEKGLVSTGDMGRYANALVKCEEKLAARWDKLETAAVDAGTVCPSTGDQVPIENFVDACVQSVAVAVGGGTLGPDPVTCSMDLLTCSADLGACTGDLGVCSSNLTACMEIVSVTNADLGICNANLGACSSDLATCGGNLSSTNADLGTCNSDLSTTNADLGICTGDLATANAGTAAVGNVLSGKTFTSTAGLGATGTMPNNGAVALTPTMSDQAIAAGYHDGSGKCSGDADLVAANIRNGVDLFGLAGTLGLQKTGQTLCYNTAGSVIACADTGQDGEFQKGATRSFTDNGNGTVTDNLTGLMWEKQSDDGTIHDKDNTYTWDNAFAMKVGTLNSGSFAGHNDWRLPNVVELQSLVSYGAVNPSTFSAFDTSCTATCTVLTCSCTQSSLYWSSSTYQPSPTSAQYVGFYNGYTAYDPKTYSRAVRAVRAGS